MQTTFSSSCSFHRKPLATAVSLALLAAGTLAYAPTSSAQAITCTEAQQNGCVELSASPAQDTIAVPPNIVLILDDSGSMQWNYMPDSNYLNYNTTYLRNAANNRVYYDPTIEYKPPPKADGSFYTNYRWEDGHRITNIPLSGVNEDWGNGNITTHPGSQRGYSNSFAYYTSETVNRRTYYYFTFAKGPVSSAQTTYYVASAAQGCGPGKSNCVTEDAMGDGRFAPPGVRVGTNIANWFAYYRNRILMAKSGLMTAFVDLSPNYRFGFGAINNRNSEELPSSRYSSSYMTISDVRPFGDGSPGTIKAQFWSWLSTMDPSGSTPLRRSLESAGEYYKTAEPWATLEGDPNYVAGGSNSEELACRSSYTILTTDGFWNGSAPSSTLRDSTESDGTQYTSPDGSTTARYNAVPPFSGGTASNTSSLADIAAYYWKNDLRPDIPNLVPTSKRDPAFWQHMTTFAMGIGFSPVTKKDGPELDLPAIFKWADDGGGTDSPYAIPDFSWPTPSSDNVTNIADAAHAGVVGHGDYFSAKDPQELAEGFAKAIAQISERNVPPQPRNGNASVAVTGALTFDTGYNTGNWSGTLEAVEMKPDGSRGNVKWNVTALLDDLAWSSRKVYTSVYKDVDCTGSGTSNASFDKGIVFDAGAAGSLDCWQIRGLESPPLAGGNDTRANRINYLLGDNTYEGSIYRPRSHKLGAIIRSQPVYVAYPGEGYYDSWPSGSPEANAATGGNGYSKFVTDNADREGTLYIGANDGMLHAFSAPAPECVQNTDDLTQMDCTYSSTGGRERWAYVPRAVYSNLGNLTDSDFSFRPTVDGTPRSRDVFINGKWSTLLTGGMGVGGRGVYALDVTDPTAFDESKVLWEFDSDARASAGCVSNFGSCQPSDLGYSVPQPHIGRLSNGKWVVLVSNGYFPDCSQPSVPTDESESGSKPLCKAIADQAPDYGALFVLDAQTGDLIAELKTPTNITGVSSYGLGSPVLGDYESDQIDDVAFAGDLMGNLWRFDLTDPNPSNWSVSLTYSGKTGAGGKQGIQPITVMPRLFPDPFSSRFMVVFGTGKYLSAGDNDLGIPVQSAYGIRERMDDDGNPVTVQHSELVKQTLTEEAGTGSLTGAKLRKLTNQYMYKNDNGWYFDFDIPDAKGERVVVTPGAIFPTNGAVFTTLIPSTENYCDPSTKGAVMMVNAGNGGAGSGVSSLGGGEFVGARVSHVSTSGTTPLVTKMGGGGVLLPMPIEGIDDGGGNAETILELDAPVWRRRSWSELDTDQ